MSRLMKIKVVLFFYLAQILHFATIASPVTMKNAKSALFGYVSIGIVALVAKTHNQAKRKRAPLIYIKNQWCSFFVWPKSRYSACWSLWK